MYKHPTFGACWGLGRLLLLQGLELGLVLLLAVVPLLPVVQDAIQHGSDCRVETGELLDPKRNIYTQKHEVLLTYTMTL